MVRLLAELYSIALIVMMIAAIVLCFAKGNLLFVTAIIAQLTSAYVVLNKLYYALSVYEAYRHGVKVHWWIFLGVTPVHSIITILALVIFIWSYLSI